MHWPTRGRKPASGNGSGPVYGIDVRPTELAFVNHFTGCNVPAIRDRGSIVRKAGTVTGWR